MKVQVKDNKIAVVGVLSGTPAEGIYEVIGEISETEENTFEIIDDVLHITGIRPSIKALADSDQYNDYKQKRKAIINKVAELGFENLTYEDRIVAAEMFALPVEQIDKVLTLEEKIAAGKPFNLNSIASREARLEAAMRYARNVIPYEDLIGISTELDQYGLENLYVKKGLEGTMMVNYEGRADSTGLFDYLFGTGGFTGAGLPSKNIVFLYNLTLQEVTDKLTDILVDGNY
jgi:hypothetical protein